MVILPPTLCMGGTFPLVAKIVARGPHVVGRGIGNVYAVNTLGAIVGSWAAGFVAIPLLGVHATLALTALLSVAVGGALLASGSLSRLRQGLLYAGLLGLFVVVLLAAPTLRFADIAGEPEKAVLHYEEGVAGVVKVATDVYDRKLLSINGWSVAGTGTPNRDVALVNDYPEVQKMLAHLPMLLHAAPRRALVIGFGAGGTVWSLSRYAALERIDVVEFVPGVIRAASFFPEVNHGVLADPRVSVTIDDGRNYLLVTPHTYDVVSVDTLDPKHAGNGNLYTREFYELSKRVLRPGGIFVQWLPYHQVDNASLKIDRAHLPARLSARHHVAEPLQGIHAAPRHPRAPADRRGQGSKRTSALPPSRATSPRCTWPRRGNCWRASPCAPIHCGVTPPAVRASTPTTTPTWSSTVSRGTTPSRRTSRSWRALPTTSRRS